MVQNVYHEFEKSWCDPARGMDLHDVLVVDELQRGRGLLMADLVEKFALVTMRPLNQVLK